MVNPIHRMWFMSLPHLSNKNLHILSESTKCLIHGDNLSSEWFLVLNMPHPLADPEIMFLGSASGHSSPCSCCQPPATCATAHCTSTCPCYFLFAVTNQCCKFQTPPTISMFALTFYCSHACCLPCYAHTWFSEVHWFLFLLAIVLPFIHAIYRSHVAPIYCWYYVVHIWTLYHLGSLLHMMDQAVFISVCLYFFIQSKKRG